MVAPNEPNTSDREIVISRIVHFPRELVWDALTDPEKVIHWWGPRGFTTRIEKMDFRVGGIWKHVMRGPDGTEYPNQSTFTEIEKPKRIVYVHGGRKTGAPAVNAVFTWSFDELPDGATLVTIRQVYASREERDLVVKTYGAIEGGKQTLARMTEFIIRKGKPLVVERTYSAPVAKVWRALTDPAAIEKWFFNFVGFKAEAGNEFNFLVEHNGEKFDHRCQVTEVTPEKKIAYTWRYQGASGDSLVTIELFPEKEGTRLRLTHEGLENFPPDARFARTNFERGWNSLIGEELPKFLEG